MLESLVCFFLNFAVNIFLSSHAFFLFCDLFWILLFLYNILSLSGCILMNFLLWIVLDKSRVFNWHLNVLTGIERSPPITFFGLVLFCTRFMEGCGYANWFSNIHWNSFRSIKDCVTFWWLWEWDTRLFMNKLLHILICLSMAC